MSLRRLGLLAGLVLLVSAAAQQFVCNHLNVEDREEYKLWHGFDLRLRVHEAECLVQGIDPFDVWNGTVKLNGYVPFQSTGSRELWDSYRANTKIVHVYPPWSYTMIMPLLLVPESARYAVFTGFEVLVLVLLTVGCLCRSRFRGNPFPIGVLSVGVASLAFPVNIEDCLHFGNYGILIAGCVAVALWCHNARRDGWAGVFWALIMVKPQIGLLFFVALLALGKWRTLICASFVLVLLSIPPCLMCGHSPIDMMLGVFSYTSYDYFPFVGFLTKGMVAVASFHGVRWLPLTLSLLVGSVSCFWLTHLFARSQDAFIAFIPATLLSTVWAVGGWAHDHSLDVVAFASLTFLMAEFRSPIVWGCASVVVLSAANRLFGITSWPIPNAAVLIMIGALFGLGYAMRRKQGCHVSAYDSR